MRRRKPLSIVTLVALVSAIALTGLSLFASSAYAASLSASPSTVPAGGTTTLSGTGYAPGQSVALTFSRPNVCLGPAQADASGGLSQLVTIPGNTTGAQTANAVSDNSAAASGSTPITVTGGVAPPANASMNGANPFFVAAGSQTTVSGTGFTAGETVAFRLDGVTALGTATANPTGGVSRAVTIPASTLNGEHCIDAIGGTSGVSGAVLAFVTGGSGTASITANPTAVTPGSTTTISGSGFAPGQTVTITWDNPAATLGTANTGSTGSFSQQVTIPAGGALGNPPPPPNGTHTVTATSPTTSATTTVTLTGGSTARDIVVTPASGPAGSGVAIRGWNFTPSATVNLTFDNPFGPLASTPTNATGAFGHPTPVSATIPAGAPTGAHTITASDGTGTATEPFTVTASPGAPTLTVTPNSGTAGSSVTLSGANWTPNQQVVIQFDTPNTTLASPTANGSGSFSGVAATIPAAATDGAHTLTASQGANSATTTFTVTPPPPPDFTVSPTSGGAGSNVTFSGTAWTPGTPVVITFDNPNTQLANPTPNASGAFSNVAATIPAGASNGAHTITATQGANTDTLTFTVTPNPTVSVAPTSGTPGSSVTFAGANWDPNLPVTISFDNPNSTLASPTADGTGSFTGATGTIPASATTGAHTITANQGAKTATTTFTVNAPPPASVAVSPTSGLAGSAVTLSGDNWTANQPVTITFDNPNTTLGSPVPNAGGSFSGVSATIPANAPAGAHTITATQGAKTATTPFTVNAPPPPATLSVSPTSGNAGSAVTFAGTGWTPNQQVTIKFDTPNSTLASPTADGAGAFSGVAGSIPAGASAGSHTITATQGSNTATATFTVNTTSPPLINVTPSSGIAGSNVTLSGANWPANQAVTIRFDNASTLATPTADASGNFGNVGATIPSGAAVGSHLITGTSGGSSASTTFNVTPDSTTNAALSISPSSGAAGSTAAFSGSGFAPNTTVTITDDLNQTVASPTSNASGAFSNVSGTISSSLSPGTHTFTARDSSSHAATAFFTVTSTITGPPGTITPFPGSSTSGPSITLTPNVVSPGQAATLSGSGFPANSVQTATMFSTPVVLATFTVRPDGTFLVTVTIPATATPGLHQLVVGTNGGVFASTVFAVAPAGFGGFPGFGGFGTLGGIPGLFNPASILGQFGIGLPPGVTGAGAGSGQQQQEQQQAVSAAPAAAAPAAAAPAAAAPGRVAFTGVSVSTNLLLAVWALAIGSTLTSMAKSRRRFTPAWLHRAHR